MEFGSAQRVEGSRGRRQTTTKVATGDGGEW